jgi:hypothetical protein
MHESVREHAFIRDTPHSARGALLPDCLKLFKSSDERVELSMKRAACIRAKARQKRRGQALKRQANARAGIAMDSAARKH